MSIVFFQSCGSNNSPSSPSGSADTATFTPATSATPTNSPTATSTATSTMTFTWTLTATSTFTSTPTRTSTQTHTKTPTSTPSSTPTQTSTATNSPSSTPTSTPTLTGTNTSTPTVTYTPTATATFNPACLKGYSSPDAANNFNTSTYMVGYPVTIASPATAYYLLASLGSPVSGNMVLGLYTNSTGPAVLQAAATITSPVASTINTVSIPATALAAGIYWIVFSTQNGPFNFGTQTGGGTYVASEFYIPTSYNGSLPNSLAGTGSITTSSPIACSLSTCP